MAEASVPREAQAGVAVRRVAALINPGAGAFRQASAEVVRHAIEQSFAEHGIAAEIAFAEGKGVRRSTEAALAKARHGEINAIVVGGGDGSIRTAASVLAGTQIPLGVIPLGTRNHFAKDLDIPLDINVAVAIIGAGHTRRIDLAEVNGETFVNNSSIGLYPYLVIDRERRQAAHRLAKWMAVVPAFFRMLRHFPRRRLRVSAEGFARPYRTPCLFVGNNAYSTELFTFGRRCRLDAGALWFYVVKPRNPFEFFIMVCRLCFGRMNQERDLDTLELPEAEVSAKASRLPVALDGDVQIMRPPLRYRSTPGALRVLVPGPPEV